MGKSYDSTNPIQGYQKKGYVVFNLKKSNLPNYYRGTFNKYPGVNIHELNIYDFLITYETQPNFLLH